MYSLPAGNPRDTEVFRSLQENRLATFTLQTLETSATLHKPFESVEILQFLVLHLRVLTLRPPGALRRRARSPRRLGSSRGQEENSVVQEERREAGRRLRVIYKSNRRIASTHPDC